MVNKLYQSIGQVCEITGLDRSKIYFWEKEIKFLKPSRSSGGHRYYSNEQIELLLYIKRLRYEEGYNIEGVKKRLSTEKQLLQPGKKYNALSADVAGQISEDHSAEQPIASELTLENSELSHDSEKFKRHLKNEFKDMLSILQNLKNELKNMRYSSSTLH
ncbi:MAG: MerR family transcriptional regulator [Deferribacteraceae bacterium]|jgi:DNA-binding transcriptional MerR regulator|nr:MerR family transcriptional regulator [Deferribacteraceae bacterium]